MKRLFVAVALSAALTPVVNAATPGLGKDCTHPLSDYGIQVLESSPDFAALKPELNKALHAFCAEGRSRVDIGFAAAEELATKTADKWIASHDPKTKNPRAINNIGGALYNAWMGGFTGLDLPNVPKVTSVRQPINLSVCDQLTKDAVQSSIPPKVTITIGQYKKMMGEWGMICLMALQQGYEGKQRNPQVFGVLSKEATDLYNQAFDAGAVQ
ncbi:hypothetical protein AI2795V1_4709 (plasmid) [Serratia marcescens]|uniref:hypothetical protein n=1 Tax=Serratia marcescens TaxID=615 RepID=UPI001D6A1F3D|nr:hypothetical protein [Serratia marcescens]CAE7797995.1 hypothetical protein AI2795V1_4709 [Serratia marcescens]CAH3929925.1 hypothetical protein AI2795V1_4709 [Serratia marcescens]